MLLLDNLLVSPLLWIFKEINEAVQKEQAGEAESLTRALSELYMKLDTGAITEAEFEASETQLLDQLDALHDRDDARAQEAGVDPTEVSANGWDGLGGKAGGVAPRVEH
jgi:hypothetical protein